MMTKPHVCQLTAQVQIDTRCMLVSLFEISKFACTKHLHVDVLYMNR